MVEDVPTITERVVTEVAAAIGQDATELPPLYDAIDPDALERTCESLGSGEVSFEYANHHITVNADRTVKAAKIKESQTLQSKPAADQ